MKISIIIPAYNEEEHIAETIQCALSQDYPDFEVIVSNNGSTDRTNKIAETMGVKVVTERRKGTQWARECGKKAATGEIIANIDADCLPDKDWLSNASRRFTDKDIVVVTGPYDYFDGTKFFRQASLFIQKNIYPIFHFVLQKIRKGAVMIEGNVLMRSETLSKVGGYNTSITFYGDGTDMSKGMIKHGKVVFDKNLIVKSSARRFKKEGTLKIFSLYLYHFFKVTFGGLK